MLPHRLQEFTPVVFIHPAEHAGEARYGNSATLMAGAAERLEAVLAFPAFCEIPWYADSNDGQIHQESDLHTAVPAELEAFIGRPVQPAQRLLPGFSKSGWGAFSLLLRSPGAFGFAAAWDVPFSSARLRRWDHDTYFDHIDQLTQVSLEWLAPRQAEHFRPGCRLVLYGYNLFREDTENAHRILLDNAIPHHFHNNTTSPHTWHLVWLEPLLAELVGIYHKGGQTA